MTRSSVPETEILAGDPDHRELLEGVGYGCLIYIASLIGIDPSFYEAARLDGASKWQEITKITLPSLVPTIITLLLLSIGRIFYSDFGLFYQVPMTPVFVPDHKRYRYLRIPCY